MRVVCLGFAILAAACSPQPEMTEAPAPAPAPVEAPQPAAPVRPSEVIVSEADLPPAPSGGLTVEGWGAIRIGMTLDELNAALGTNVSLADDTDYAEYQCAYLNLPAAPGQPAVMFQDGIVARLDVNEPGTATYGGLKIGDTSARARELLGRAINATTHFYSGDPAEYLTVWTVGGSTWPWDGLLAPEQEAHFRAARGIRFETDVNGVIDRLYAGNGSIEMVEGCL